MDRLGSKRFLFVSVDGGNFKGLAERALAEQGLAGRVVLSLQSYLLSFGAVAASDMVATLPRVLLEGRDRDLALFDPPLALPPCIVCWLAR